MNNISEDALRIIFEAYVHHLKQSPVNLLTVCRRWHDTLFSMSNIWSRVHINIESFHTIPRIIGNRTKDSPKERKSPQATPPLLAYLERSIPVKGKRGFPLDISIKWHKMETSLYSDDAKFYLDILFPNQGSSGRSLDRFDDFDDMDSLDSYGMGEDSMEDFDDHKHLCELQTQELIVWMAGERSVKDANYKENETAGNLSSRWRSLHIDMTQVPCHDCSEFEIHDIDFGELKNPKHRNLQSLEILSTRGAGFLIAKKRDPFESTNFSSGMSINSLKTPSLKVLEVCQGAIFPQPDFSTLESLTMVQCFASTHIQWEECKNLQTMHLRLQHGTTIFEHPKTHSFPHLTAIVLEQGVRLPMILTKLSKTFNKSRPLKLLCLAESSLDVVLQILQKAPQLHVKVLRLSSRLFYGFATSKWEWKEFEDGEWKVEERDIEHAQKLLNETGKRGISVEAADMPVEEMLSKARMRTVA